jgi:hypothetical protein
MPERGPTALAATADRSQTVPAALPKLLASLPTQPTTCLLGRVSGSRYIGVSALARQIPDGPQLNHRFRGRGCPASRRTIGVAAAT